MDNNQQAPAISNSDVDAYLAQPTTPQLQNSPQSQPSPVNQAQSQTGEPEGIDDYIKQERYGTPTEQAKAALEGLGQGIAGPLAPLAEKAMGVDPEAIRGRKEANPWTHGIAEGVGFAGSMATGIGEGALIAKAGAKLVPELATAAGMGAKIVNGGLRAATETALLASGDEVSKMINEDPHQTLQTSIADVGLSAIMGGMAGGAISAISPLWKATAAPKLTQVMNDFKAELTSRLENPEPVEAFAKELQDFHTSITEPASEVYGAKGLKARAIDKLLPGEVDSKIIMESDKLSNQMDKAVESLGEDPLAQRLASKVRQFKTRINPVMDEAGNVTSVPSAGEIFDATQELKQQLHEWGKFSKGMGPIAEQDFRGVAKDLGHTLRESLENEDIWGKAAKVQQDINGAFKAYLPNIQKLESKFMIKIPNPETGAIEMKADPGKINTYLNQLGKPGAETKKEFLSNAIKAGENYKQTISDTFRRIGEDSPVTHPSLNRILESLEEKTAGKKLAEAFVNNAGRATAGAVGGTLGSAVGHPIIGAALGEHYLKDFFGSTLPAIARHILGKETNAEGLKAAVDYGSSVVKGNNLIKRAASSIFKAGAEVIPVKIPNERDIQKLDKALKVAQVNPMAAMNTTGSPTGHYIPGHNEATGQLVANASQYLNSIRPGSQQLAPLDNEMPVSSTDKANYNRALMLAQQPLMILQHIKDGTVTPQDLQVVGNIYPQLYNKINQEIINSMIESKSKGNEVPYKTRIGISMVAGQPMDSTMLPAAIQASQMANSRQPASDQQQSQPQESGRPPQSGLNKLGKSSGSFRTPVQAAEADRQRIK